MAGRPHLIVGHLGRNSGNLPQPSESIARILPQPSEPLAQDVEVPAHRGTSPSGGWSFRVRTSEVSHVARHRGGEDLVASAASTSHLGRSYSTSRHASTGRQIGHPASRASYESALLAAVRKQIEAFEEKVGGQISRIQSQSERMKEASIARSEEKESNYLSRNVAEFSSLLKDITDQMEAQTRRVDEMDDRAHDWKNQLEDELRQKFLEFEQHAYHATSTARQSHSSAEDQLQKLAGRMQGLEQEHADRGIAASEEVLERLSVLESEVSDLHQSVSLKEAGGATAGPLASHDHYALQVQGLPAFQALDQRLEGMAKKVAGVVAEVHDMHSSLSEQEVRVRTLRTKFDAREEAHRSMAAHLEHNDWGTRLDQLHQALNEHKKENLEHVERIELLRRRLEHQESSHDALRNSHEHLQRQHHEARCSGALGGGGGSPASAGPPSAAHSPRLAAKPARLAATDGPPQKLSVTVHRATGLRHLMHFTGDAPYCVCEVLRADKRQKASRCETKSSKGVDPVWDETHELHSWRPGEPLVFTLYERGLLGSKAEGRVELRSDMFYPQGLDTALPIEGLEHATLHVTIQPAASPSAPGAAVHKESAAEDDRLSTVIASLRELMPQFCEHDAALRELQASSGHAAAFAQELKLELAQHDAALRELQHVSNEHKKASLDHAEGMGLLRRRLELQESSYDSLRSSHEQLQRQHHEARSNGAHTEVVHGVDGRGGPPLSAGQEAAPQGQLHAAKPARPAPAGGPPQKLSVTVHGATGLRHLMHFTGDAPYCVCEVLHADKRQKASRCETKSAKGVDPVWDEAHELHGWLPGESLAFTLYEKGLLGSKAEGRVELTSDRFYPQGLDAALPIEGLEHATLHVTIQPAARPSSPAAAVHKASVVENGRPMPETASLQEILPRLCGHDAALSKLQANSGHIVASVQELKQQLGQHDVALGELRHLLELQRHRLEHQESSHDDLRSSHEQLQRQHHEACNHGVHAAVVHGGDGGGGTPPFAANSAAPHSPQHVAKATRPAATGGPPQTVSVTMHQAKGLKHLMHFTGDAPYCVCEVLHVDKKQRSAKCSTKPGKGVDPVWNEKHELHDWRPGESLVFTLYEKGLLGSKAEGRVLLRSDKFYPQGLDAALPIEGLEHATLHVTIHPAASPSSPAAAVHKASAVGGERCITFDADPHEIPPQVHAHDAASRELQAGSGHTAAAVLALRREVSQHDTALRGTQHLHNEPHSPQDAAKATRPAATCGSPQTLSVIVNKATGLRHLMHFTGDAPYCVCEVLHADPRQKPSKWYTSSGKGCDPVWNARHELYNWSPGDALAFTVYEKGLLTSKAEGRVELRSDMFYPQGLDAALPIEGLEHATLHVTIVPPARPSSPAAAVHKASAEEDKLLAATAVQGLRHELAQHGEHKRDSPASSPLRARFEPAVGALEGQVVTQDLREQYQRVEGLIERMGGDMAGDPRLSELQDQLEAAAHERTGREYGPPFGIE